MNLQLSVIIHDVRSLMAYHRLLGVNIYPAGLDRLFSAVPGGVLSRKTEMEPQQPQQCEVAAVAAEKLDDIIVEINRCRACELHQQRVMPVSGHGASRARLLVVGGWLTVPGQAAVPSNTVFGLEEDRMLARMMEAIHLAPEDVFVTNILKCGLPSTIQPLAAHVQCCLAWLGRQIVLMAPEVICTMGAIPTRALLGLSQSLSQLRGRFHSYLSPDGRRIPLIATYHPSYLLQANEMKKQTWMDLQLIEKQLAG